MSVLKMNASNGSNVFQLGKPPSSWLTVNLPFYTSQYKYVSRASINLNNAS